MAVQYETYRAIPDQSAVAETDYRKATFLFKLLRWLVRWLLKALFKIEVQGLENLPKQGGYIFAGNHLSWLDPFLMLAFAPAEPRIYFIAAREMMETSGWRKFITEQIGGVIPVDRGQKDAYRQVAGRVRDALAGGGVLGIFPEGAISSTETGQLLPFKKGLGYFAAESGRVVVPVAFTGTKEPWLRKRIVMRIGEPLAPCGKGRGYAQECTDRTAQSIKALLPAPAPAGNGPKIFKKFFSGLFISGK